MKKRYLLIALLLTSIVNVHAQKSEKQKAEKYLSTQGELTFTFQVNNHNEVDSYSSDFSIVNYNPSTKTVIAWANESQFRNFESRNIDFKVPNEENEVQEELIYDVSPLASRSSSRPSTLSFPVNTYPTYAEYAQQMQDFEDDYPALVDMFSIGSTGQGDKELLFVKISDNVNTDEQEPKLMFTSSMHGDEIAGYPMMLSLINYILTVYSDTGHADHARVKNLVENAELWINPSANPDGTYHNSASNTSVVNARRGNGNNIDLNRNYPDNVAGAHYDGYAYQTETLAFMALADANHFVIAANFHGGTELVNYPFDNAYVSQYTHPDGDWFEYTGVEYATHCQTDANSGSTASEPYSYKASYMTDDDDSNVYPSPGVTHGAEWYRVYGGRQDYMNYYQQCREVTIELSDTKILPESQLDDYWYYNRDALLDFLTQGTYGFRGTVVDDTTGNPIDATITVLSHDAYGSQIVNDIAHGDYYRPIKAGTYSLLIEAPCFQSETISSQAITDGNTVDLGETRLIPGAEIPSGATASAIGSTTATIDWNAQTGNTFDFRYRQVGTSTWTNVNGLTPNTYDITGLAVGIQYEAQIRSICGALTPSDYSSSVLFTTENTVNIHSGYFESGWDNWTSGGNDASRYTGGTYSYENAASIQLRDGSGLNSSMTSETFDLTGYNSIEFSFYYYPRSMEDGENFLLQYYNGSVWTSLKNYVANADFNNGNFYNDSITLDSSSYNLDSNAQFRFQCDASNNNDYIYIDQVIITGTPTPAPSPEINITGNSTSIVDGDSTPSATDDTVFGSTSPGSPINKTFTIENSGNATLNVGAISFSGTNPSDFSVTSTPSSTVADSGGSTTFVVTFNPTANGSRSAIISIVNDDIDENPYNFTIQGTGDIPFTEGPGGVFADIQLWLKANEGVEEANADSAEDADAILNWLDNSIHSNNAIQSVGVNKPIFNEVAINFNPAIDFDGVNHEMTAITSANSIITIFAVAEGTYNTTKNLINLDNGSNGFVDLEQNSSTTIRGRYYDGTSDSGIISSSMSDGVPFLIDYEHNAGNNSELFETGESQGTSLANSDNLSGAINVGIGANLSTSSTRWNGGIAELIVYNQALTATERDKIETYLAIKYGFTLGTIGTSQDYIDSDGNIIWNQSDNIGFNYNVTGVGRDDVSGLNQKQSKTINDVNDITLGIENIAPSNDENTANFLADKTFLTWGHNNGSTNTSAEISKDLSSGVAGITTSVSVTPIARTWKLIANGTIPQTKLSIPKSMVSSTHISGEEYTMIIGDDASFTTNVKSATMTDTGSNLEVSYSFEGTKYITFGSTPEVETSDSRSISFDGINNYIDINDALDLNPTAFTISAWINADTNSNGKSILSKRDLAFTEGYDFKLDASGKFEVSWKTSAGVIQTIVSNTIIPKNKWYHLSVVYSGGSASIYIDGVLDNTLNLTAPNDTSHSFLIGAASKLSPTNFFHGMIDEVRIWDTALNVKQLRFIMNQEIENNSSFVNGSYFKSQNITPTKNDIASISWSDLAAYYPMTTFTFTNIKDESSNDNHGALNSISTVNRQTAPLPYKSISGGEWNTDATWENGSVQTIPGHTSIVNSQITIDWNIVETSHDITMDNSVLPDYSSRSVQFLNNHRTLLGLLVTSNKLTLEGDNDTNDGNGLSISHYLKIDGKIDLDGESQLVQDEDSDLDPTSSGTLEKDQQGTQDTFTYNYWSSPVGVSNATTNNNSYTLNDNIFKDGSNTSVSQNINFISGYDGSNGTPIGIAKYWIWKFSNRPSDDYASWQNIRNTGTILAGEGFTMKGITDTGGVVSLQQNYTIEGKPNNGEITVPINAGNDYLVGNPYPSAIDAEQFILDNGPNIEGNGNTTGTIYFWEHWGGGSHYSSEYQGGYATYNLSGGTPSASIGTSHPDIATGGTPTKIPGRYIPVAQGFFITGEATGTIRFNNGQRFFQQEGTSSSIYIRASESTSSSPTENADNGDNRTKIRLGFDSHNAIHRQLLLTVDERASMSYDWGFEAKLLDNQIDDMYWMLEDEKYFTQGIDDINESTVIPLGIHVRDSGINSITIDALINFPSDLSIYVHDIELDLYHDLRSSNYNVHLDAGEYLDRFEITFTNQALSIDEITTNSINAFYANDTNEIVIYNPHNLEIDNVKIVNMLGQVTFQYYDFVDNSSIEIKTKKLSTGTYILKLETEIGEISKKVLIN